MERLPDLAFGNTSARLEGGMDIASEAMSHIVPTLNYLTSRKSPEFLTKFSTARVGSIGLFASSVLRCQMEVSNSSGWHLIIPYYGQADVKFEKTSVGLAGAHNALLLPNVPRVTDNAIRSVVIAALDIRRLHETAALISGRDPHSFAIDNRHHEVDLRKRRELFPAFQRICGLIDSLATTPQVAELLGVDDMLYRWAALALELPYAAVEQADGGYRDKHCLDVVCDLIHSNHERPLTLTEMERVSGLSARGLQYAFKSRFNCSPMEWQRRERIQWARKRLISAAPGETITQIAHAMGYSSSAAFATQYRQYFEETPTQTLKFRSGEVSSMHLRAAH